MTAALVMWLTSQWDVWRSHTAHPSCSLEMHSGDLSVLLAISQDNDYCSCSFSWGCQNKGETYSWCPAGSEQENSVILSFWVILLLQRHEQKRMNWDPVHWHARVTASCQDQPHRCTAVSCSMVFKRKVHGPWCSHFSYTTGFISSFRDSVHADRVCSQGKFCMRDAQRPSKTSQSN